MKNVGNEKKITWIFVCLNFRYRMISCEDVKRQRNWNEHFFCCHFAKVETVIMMRVDAPHFTSILLYHCRYHLRCRRRRLYSLSTKWVCLLRF